MNLNAIYGGDILHSKFYGKRCENFNNSQLLRYTPENLLNA